MGWAEKPSFPVTRAPSARVCTPANAIPWSMTWRSTPSRPQRKSRCHHERRNSPSVTERSPASSCFLITRSISRSSIVARSAADISPFARFSRASFNALGRNRLPTWSARNGGLLRCIPVLRFQVSGIRSQVSASLSLRCLIPDPWLPPYLTRDIDDPFKLRPLLVLSEDIALLRGRKTALRRKTDLLERNEFRRLLDPPFHLVLGFKVSAL